MNPERNFGASSVAEDNPGNLEGYGNESLKEFAEISSPLGAIIAEGLGFPPDCPAESRLWRFKKDPWQFYSDSGQLLFTLENSRLTVFRAEDRDGGSRGNVILRFDWTDQRRDDADANRQEIAMIVRGVNNEGDCVFHWDLAGFAPQRDWIRRPVSYMQDIDPGIFEQITAISWHLFFGKSRLYEC